MKRVDYEFAFRIDGASRQGAQASSYARHVEQMIRQVLLTAPGERVNLPEFGCGLRRLLFGFNDAALGATTKLLVAQALDRWMKEHIEVTAVDVRAGDDAPHAGSIVVSVAYVLLDTRTAKRLEVRVA